MAADERANAEWIESFLKEDREVTPEMIEAGYRALRNSGIVDECLEADKLVVLEIYRAMAALRPAGAISPPPR